MAVGRSHGRDSRRRRSDLVIAGEIKKGDVLATARIAGIMAGKKTSELIPLCHPLMLTHVGVEFTPLPERHAFRIVASAKTMGQTGVEMEAMTAAASPRSPSTTWSRRWTKALSSKPSAY